MGKTAEKLKKGDKVLADNCKKASLKTAWLKIHYPAKWSLAVIRIILRGIFSPIEFNRNEAQEDFEASALEVCVCYRK